MAYLGFFSAGCEFQVFLRQSFEFGESASAI